MFPTYPDGTVELIPGYKIAVPDAVNWLAGAKPLPGEPPNDAVRLIEIIAYRKGLERNLQQNELLLTLQQDQRTEEQRRRTEGEVENLKAGLAAADQDLRRLQLRLWGNSSEESPNA